MEVGSEISEKIQLAIKAKLKDINAYVDDELPDYIMIMVANRKPEEQMTEALSLFLGDHAKNFTKWLFELLTGLQEKPATKKEFQKTETEVKKASNLPTNAEIKVITPKEKHITGKSSDPAKPSRWDVKKHVKRRSSSNLETDSSVVETTDKNTIANEAIIDILTEKNDLLDDDLLDEPDADAGKNLTKLRSTDNLKKTSKSSGSVKSLSSSNYESEKPRLLKKSAVTSSEKALDHHSSHKEDTKKAESSGKRTVSVKSSKVSSKRVSSNKEKPSKSPPLKVKKKKLKRSHEKEHSSSQKSKAPKTSPKYSREWDKGKGQEQLKYNDSQIKTKKSDSTKQKDSHTVRPKLTSQVSSTVVVAKDELYESEDSDENSVTSAVISKVSVPKRHSRLPPSKQANRSLLLRAVSEAEFSIKKHCLVNKIIEPVSEEVFKTKVEKHKRIALDEVIEKKKKTQVPDSSKHSISSRLLRENNLLKPSESKSLSQSSNKEQLVIKKRKLAQDNNVKVEKRTKENHSSTASKKKEVDSVSQSFGDSRRIIPREKSLRKQPEKSPVSPALKKSKQSCSDSDDEISLKTKKKNRTPSPCFIVTLDGSSKSNSKNIKTTTSEKTSLSSSSGQGVKTSKDKETVSLKRTTVSNSDQASKSTKISKPDDSALSENELNNMRKKLLAMQEQAKKLKELQARQQELLKRKQSNGQVKVENKTVHLANVHFSATEKQISDHFAICGKVTNVTILKDQFSGHSKG